MRSQKSSIIRLVRSQKNRVGNGVRAKWSKHEIIGAKRVKADAVIMALSAMSDISYDDIMGRKKDRATVLARKTAYRILREKLGMTLQEVAMATNRRDHSSVISGLRSIDNYRHTSDFGGPLGNIVNAEKVIGALLDGTQTG